MNPYALIQQGGLSSVTNCDNGFALGKNLSSNNLALAKPPPYVRYPN